ncbi:MAG: type II toxin-antitoxin system HicB family antitoxin [Nitrospirota bacterium]
MRYPIFIEKDPTSDYGVTVPDIPGCFSAGTTLEEALVNAEEAILTHIEGLMIDNEAIPIPSTIDNLKDQYQGEGSLWALVQVDMTKLSDKTKRINISVSENLLSKIDAYATREGETRSGLLVTAALEYMSLHSN